MSEILKWIDTTGGPHVLIPQELVAHWKGVTGWFDNADPHDQSDYARACRVTSWLGMVSCGAGCAVVLSGDVGRISWVPQTQLLIQCIASDGDKYVNAAVSDGSFLEAVAEAHAEEIPFSTGRSGQMCLFDSSEAGTGLRSNVENLNLCPGTHVIHAGYFESRHLSVVVRRIFSA